MEAAIDTLVAAVFCLLMIYAFVHAHGSNLGGYSAWIIVLGSLGCAVGISLIVLNSIQLWVGFQSRRWPTVGGTVTESVYTSGRRPTWNGFIDYQHGKISYQYNVDGINYVSHRLTVSEGGPIFAGDWAEYVRNHRVGDDVIIYFNAQEPQYAVLRPGPTFSNGLGLSLGMITSVAGSGLCFRRKSMVKPSKDNATNPAASRRCRVLVLSSCASQKLLIS